MRRQTTTTRPRRIALLVILAVLLFGGLSPTEAVAQADPPADDVSVADTFYTRATEPVNQRSCPTTSCAVTGGDNTGKWLQDFCYMSGTPIYGLPWWDLVYNPVTGRAGFIPEAKLESLEQDTTCDYGGHFNWVTTSSNQHSCASTGCAATATATPTHGLQEFCWRHGPPVNGNGGYHLVYNRNLGNIGFIPEARLANKDRSILPVCQPL